MSVDESQARAASAMPAGISSVPPMYHDGMRALQDRFDTRRLADRLVDVTVSETFGEPHRKFIDRASNFFLATCDADGWPDCSYKGGRPGFVKVVDDHTLLFGLYDGNGMYRSAGNITVNPRIGMLFVDMERPNRMRVNGIATLHDDPASLTALPGAELAVKVRATKIFWNCSRYVHKVVVSELSPYAPDAGYTPPEPEWKSMPEFMPYLPQRGAATVSEGEQS